MNFKHVLLAVLAAGVMALGNPAAAHWHHQWHHYVRHHRQRRGRGVVAVSSLKKRVKVP
jgi:hypothetical protein